MFSNYFVHSSGQFGYTEIDDLTSSGALWTLYPSKPYRLVLTLSGGAQTISLPTITTDNLGLTINVVNNDGTNTLTINNDVAALVYSLGPQESVLLSAKTASSTWSTIKSTKLHASAHISGGGDQTDGDTISIDYLQTNFL